jgi:23S rRNA (cytosine1962-C5)-methyltransferase
MLTYPIITLLKGKEISILKKHHWIFSGAIAQKDVDLKDGQIVQVFSQKNEFLGLGFFNYGSIMVRMVSFEEEEINEKFWIKKIEKAHQLRKSIGLTSDPSTNAYRLIHGEGDGIPGLIIDYYQGTAVIQTYHVGVYEQIPNISLALQQVLGVHLKAVYDKSADILGKILGNIENRLIFGNPETHHILESNCHYEVDWEKGQKTGFFMDQRDNRSMLGKMSRGKKVLNTFCYSGGFSVAALMGGAKEVHSVDISEKAIELTLNNVQLNKDFKGKHSAIAADVMKYIKEVDASYYDIIVLDPPAFAKNLRAKDNAVKAYKRLNTEAISRIKSGGILFTFSCSQVVDKQLFNKTITQAALEARRNVKVLHYLSQPADHPVNPFHPETEYLKGLVLYIE